MDLQYRANVIISDKNGLYVLDLNVTFLNSCKLTNFLMSW